MNPPLGYEQHIKSTSFALAIIAYFLLIFAIIIGGSWCINWLIKTVFGE